MELTELRFKDQSPEKTVEKIKACLADIGITLKEKLIDPGIGNCYSVHAYVDGGYPMFTNGKGVTPLLARASAYGEFIERIQCGLFLYKFQSMSRDRQVAMHYYAPDGKYLTVEELEQQGDWMDAVVKAYGNGLTRKKIAQQCLMYSNAADGKVWCTPYYSLFEDRYVYMPVDFVEQIYASNGCCAGNTREEAWVHALSEITERSSTIRVMTSGQSVPRIPDEVLKKYELPWSILQKLRESKDLDITVLDFSDGTGMPVIGIRLINKKTQGYLVNTAADPVFEIALSRGLTEIFQGQVLENITSVHDGTILGDNETIPLAHNVMNQVENGNGLFKLPFFTEDVCCSKAFVPYDDNSGKNNKELLEYMLGRMKAQGRQVYVRNVSFLGFPSYYILVPGLSESRGVRMIAKTQEHGLGDIAAGVFRNPLDAQPFDLILMPKFVASMQTAWSRREHFARLAGLPLSDMNRPMLYLNLAYAHYRMRQLKLAAKYLDGVLGEAKALGLDESQRQELKCFAYYLKTADRGIAEPQLRSVMDKFCDPGLVEGLYATLQAGKTPLDPYLLRCDTVNCADCRYQSHCSYAVVKSHIAAAGEKYKAFTNGQNREVFKV